MGRCHSGRTLVMWLSMHKPESSGDMARYGSGNDRFRSTGRSNELVPYPYTIPGNWLYLPQESTIPAGKYTYQSHGWYGLEDVIVFPEGILNTDTWEWLNMELYKYQDRFVSVMKNTPTAHHLTFGEPGSLGSCFCLRSQRCAALLHLLHDMDNFYVE